MEEERSILDICNDINETLENYERDKTYINHKKIDRLNKELFTTLTNEKEKEQKVNSSFICLVDHLYKSINNDKYIDWEHICLYNEIYQVIETIFPSIEKKYMTNLTNTTYKELNNTNTLIKSNRKHH